MIPSAPLGFGFDYQLPPNRRTLWQPGVSYAPTRGPYVPVSAPDVWSGGIPTYPQFGPTLSPTGSDDTANVMGAIAKAAAVATRSTPQAIQLSEGAFIESGNGIFIQHSYIELRGAGPGLGMKGALSSLPTSGTRIVKADGLTNPAPNVTIGNRAGGGGGALGLNTMLFTTAFLADCAAGTNAQAVASTANLSVGKLVYVNETFDPALTWFNPNGQGGTATGYNGWGEGGDGPATASRPLGQAMEIKAISGNVVSFTTPFHRTYRMSHACHLGVPNVGPQVMWSGVSNLFVTGGDGGDGGGNIVLNGLYNWVNHVESSGHGPKYGGAPVHLFSCFRCEVRDSYLHGNAADIDRISPGGGFYNIVLDAYAADNLIENNISWIANKVLVMRGTGGGNVIGYNHMDDGYGTGYLNQMETALNCDHMTTSHEELFEGNRAWGLSSDSRWGNSINATWLRNWGTSYRSSAWPSIIPSTSCATGNLLIGKNAGGVFYEDAYNRNPAKVGSHHWGFNYLANVFGIPDNMLLLTPKSTGAPKQTGWIYQAYAPSIALSQNIIPIWQIGTPDGSEAPFGGNGLDPSVLPTLLRDGNFDFFTGKSHWHGIGGTIDGLAGASMPASLYMPATPSFFHGLPWPWIDGTDEADPIPGALPAFTRFSLGTPNAV